MFDIIQYIIQRTKELPGNYLSYAADVIRIEAIYHHGGIYLDYKI